MIEPVLRVEELVVEFRDPGRGKLRAVDGVSLAIRRGEIVGLVGESGSGKTTLAKTVLRLYRPHSGRIVLAGVDVTRLGEAQLWATRRHAQMVFQDPLSSFNPRHTIGYALAVPLFVHGICSKRDAPGRVACMLEDVGLPPSFASRYPHQLSGGQLQRAAIGRALVLSPALIVADEAVSKLDVSVRAQILNLLKRVHAESGLSLLFITHDLHVARFLSDRIGIMQAGRLLEIGPTRDVFARPSHPYTQTLLGTIAPAPGEA
ncbi:MAG: ABC transporter ATP-binding protein [Acetobacteraceae bacterium]|nr:ABC transporter ATP-binding protein [Acetobacteraceae bacterium]